MTFACQDIEVQGASGLMSVFCGTIRTNRALIDMQERYDFTR